MIDNFGDAGVSWRLARQLVCEHDMAVTLWIDAIAPLAKMAPGLNCARFDQVHRGVRLRILQESLTGIDMPDVVVEAFGCGLQQPYVDAMLATTRPPLWINLEYLSGE